MSIRFTHVWLDRVKKSYFEAVHRIVTFTWGERVNDVGDVLLLMHYAETILYYT